MSATSVAFREQLESLYAISVDLARVRELPRVLDRSLGYCLELTASEFGFVGLLNGSEMDVAAIKGFQPSDPTFHERFHRIPVRPSLFSAVVKEGRPTMSNDVLHDPTRVGQPPGHPPVRTYLGVPLKVGEQIIGMIGVANKTLGYGLDYQRLLTTFANQAAVAIENARLNDEQREMIARLEKQDRDLDLAERERVHHEERERIAADLHDRIEQAIFSMGLALSGILEGDELPQATRERIVLTGPEAKLDADLQEVLLNVTREALVNVARHARARTVLVGLNNSTEHVELVIQDDREGAPSLLLEHTVRAPLTSA